MTSSFQAQVLYLMRQQSGGTQWNSATRESKVEQSRTKSRSWLCGCQEKLDAFIAKSEQSGTMEKKGIFFFSFSSKAFDNNLMRCEGMDDESGGHDQQANDETRASAADSPVPPKGHFESESLIFVFNKISTCCDLSVT